MVFSREVVVLLLVQVMVFWVLTLCCDVGYQHIREPSCLNLQAARSSETLISYHITT
jgi:hypothetical protein